MSSISTTAPAAKNVASRNSAKGGAFRANPAVRRRRLRTAAVKWSLITIALAFLFALLFVPLVAVFVQAFDKGVGVYLAALRHPDAISSILLTLMTALFVVPINLTFGVAAAWAVARFKFRGRQLVITLIDLPFAVSPVISGLIFVLLFGAQGLLGPWIEQVRRPDHLRAAGHRAGDDVRDGAVRGARADPRAAGAGRRG